MNTVVSMNRKVCLVMTPYHTVSLKLLSWPQPFIISNKIAIRQLEYFYPSELYNMPIKLTEIEIQYLEYHFTPNTATEVSHVLHCRGKVKKLCILNRCGICLLLPNNHINNFKIIFILIVLLSSNKVWRFSLMIQNDEPSSFHFHCLSHMVQLAVAPGTSVSNHSETRHREGGWEHLSSSWISFFNASIVGA